ncbi:MCE family protein [Nocardioides pocheonensis]|uniref:MCE family protein n=1 Tax=Nocardioides pocheonensis TaxID=661485 RepID=A0A3N0GUJ1_9ACTN|nr:MCE family protein [Nocardioides pocheonensis]RNM16127.1 MCE family protein [Nocardioides pocheonensis]
MSALLRRRPVGLFLVVALAFVLSSCRFDGAYDLPLPGGKAVKSGDAITVTAEFTDALNVVPRTAVMVDDVPVGQVSQVDRVGWHAKITMQIRKDLVLPANTAAEIRQTSLLGEKYVALVDPVGTPPTGRLANGADIPLSATSRNPEVEEVLGALSFVLSGGGIGQLHTISTELNKMMNGRTDEMRNVLDRINTLVSTLDGQKDDIITAMSAIDRLSATLNKESRSVGAAIDAIGPAVKVLNQQHRALVTMLSELDKLGQVGTRVIRGSRENLVATLRHLEPTLRELSDAGMSLPRGLGLLASFPFPKEAANLAMGDYANALFFMKFDLNKLFGSGSFGNSSNIPNPVEICMATPFAPVCQTLNDTLIKQLCSLMPSNPLCPNSGNGGTIPGLPGTLGGNLNNLLGGLLGGGTTTGSSTQRSSSSGMVGLLGGGS